MVMFLRWFSDDIAGRMGGELLGKERKRVALGQNMRNCFGK
jgi:hypothetical protein